MRRFIALSAVLIAVVSLFAGVATAATIGLWFDTEFTVNITDPITGAPFEAYLVIHDPDPSGLAGLEFAVEISDPTVFVLQVDWLHQGTNFGDLGCALVGYPELVPAAPAIHVATFSLLNSNPSGDILFSVVACPGAMCPNYTDGNGTVHCLETTLGGGVVACMGGCSVGTEAASWSSIKTLYR